MKNKNILKNIIFLSLLTMFFQTFCFGSKYTEHYNKMLKNYNSQISVFISKLANAENASNTSAHFKNFTPANTLKENLNQTITFNQALVTRLRETASTLAFALNYIEESKINNTSYVEALANKTYFENLLAKVHLATQECNDSSENCLFSLSNAFHQSKGINSNEDYSQQIITLIINSLNSAIETLEIIPKKTNN